MDDDPTAPKGAGRSPSGTPLDEPDPDGPREYLGAQLGSGEQGPLRLVIHYTSGLRPEVRALGESLGAEFIDVSGSDTAYFDSFDRLWLQGRSYINGEQDALPTVALLDAMWRCDHELCGGYYWQGGHPVMPGKSEPRPGGADRVTHTLACVKFSAALLARLPNAMKDAIRRSPARRWTQLDLALIHPNGVLAQHGAEVHVHEPAIQHLHSAPWPR